MEKGDNLCNWEGDLEIDGGEGKDNKKNKVC